MRMPRVLSRVRKSSNSVPFGRGAANANSREKPPLRIVPISTPAEASKGET